MAFDLALLGEKLRRYRTQLQVSLQELSRATGISEDALATYEAGSKEPTGDEILILSDFYKCDYKFFVSNEKLAPYEQTETLFRRFGDDFSKDDRWAVQELLFLCEVEGFLERALNRPAPLDFQFTKRGTFFKQQAAQAASELRRLLHYADQEVPRNIYENFRSIGIHVFRRRLENTQISGLFVRHPVAGRCVLVNYNEDVYRQRFTVAHETAHAIFDEDDDVVVSFGRKSQDLVEIRANVFASRYLLPPPFLRMLPEPQRWDREKAVTWADRLRVNTETLAYALSDEGLIDRATVSLITSAKVPRYRKQDPELPETLSPASRSRKEELLKRGLSDSYVRLGFDAYRAGIISSARLREMLLLRQEAELQDLAALYREVFQYGD
jgi:Zn-dependent peptidase ImmA (M78 family)